MALSPRLLIRMRSQVQVLAGPPPKPAGHSAAGSELGAPAASPGRAGAARPPRRHAHWPSRARPPGRQAPRPPPNVVAYQPKGGGHAAAAATSRRRLLLCPQRSRSRRRSVRRPGLPSPQRSSAAARTQPGLGPPPTPPTTRELGSLARVRPARPSTQPLHGMGAHRTSTRCCGEGCPPAPTRSPTPPPEVGRDGRVRPTGADSSRLDAEQVDSRRPDTGRAGHRTGGHQTAGHRTLDTGRPDQDDATAGWTPHGGRGPATDAMAGVLALPATTTTPDRWMPAGRPAGQPPSRRPSRTAQQ
jgi:hypothetical protein